MHFRELHASDRFHVYDVACDGQDRSEEEVSELKIVLCRSGLFLHEARGETTICEPGRAVLFRPRESYRVRHPLGCGDRTTSVGVSAEVLEDTRRSHGPRRGSWRRGVLLGPRATLFGLHLRERAIARARRDPADRLAVEEGLETLVDHVLQRASSASRPGAAHLSTGRNRRAALEALELLHLRHAESFPLDALAREVGLSPFHLCRVFRANFGCSIHATRTRLRLEAAAQAILDGTPDLAALANGLGFGTHSHFTATFRRAYGLTPTELRRHGPGPPSVRGSVPVSP